MAISLAKDVTEHRDKLVGAEGPKHVGQGPPVSVLSVRGTSGSGGCGKWGALMMPLVGQVTGKNSSCGGLVPPVPNLAPT